jgi:hypothetical protein
VQVEPVRVVLGSTYLRNELSLLNYRISVSKLQIEISRRDQLDLMRVFCKENKRANIESLTINGYALEASGGYQYDLSIIGGINPKKLYIKELNFELDVHMLPKSARVISLEF